jgi:hypothetical protein
MALLRAFLIRQDREAHRGASISDSFVQVGGHSLIGRQERSANWARRTA